jgi:type I restriction enzyme S subunit
MALNVALEEIVGNGHPLLAIKPHWERIRLSEVGRVLNGYAFKSTHFSRDGGMPLVRIRDVGNDASDTFYSGEFDERYVVEAGDLLVGMDGDFNCARWRGPRALLNQRVCKIAIDSTAYLPRFLDYVLPGYLKAINDATSSITVKHLSSRTVEDIPLPLPPLEEQRAIADEIEKQFSRLDEAVASLQRVKANLKRYKASVLKAAIEGSSAKRGTPDHTSVQPLAQVAEVQLGQQRAPIHAAADAQIPYLRAANITWEGLDLSDVKSMGFPNAERYRLQVGDVLLSEASGSASEVGKPAIWNGEIPGACYQKTLIRIRAKPGKLLPRFIYYYFLHTCISGQFARLAPGVGILHLTAERMLGWRILVPSIEQQSQILIELDRKLSFLRELEIEVEANLKRAQALRQAILAKAFSGAHA